MGDWFLCNVFFFQQILFYVERNIFMDVVEDLFIDITTISFNYLSNNNESINLINLINILFLSQTITS
jgi:hypothetical protein